MRNSSRKEKKPQILGKVVHYFDKIKVAVIKLSVSLKVGDCIRIQTKGGDFTQVVDSIQINHKNIPGAKKGSEVGLKVKQKVKEGDLVFKAEQLPAEPPNKKPAPCEKSKAPAQESKPSGYNEIKFLKF